MELSNYRVLALSNGSVTRKDFELAGCKDDMAIMVGAGVLFTWLNAPDLAAPDFAWCVVECLSTPSYMTRVIEPSERLLFTNFTQTRKPSWNPMFQGHILGKLVNR